MRSTTFLLPVLGLLSGVSLASPTISAKALAAPAHLDLESASAAKVNATEVSKRVTNAAAAPAHIVGDLLAVENVNATETSKRNAAEPAHLAGELVSADKVNSTSVVKRALGAVSDWSSLVIPIL